MSKNILVVISEHATTASLLEHVAKDVYKPGDRLQLLYVTSVADLLKEAAAIGEQEPAQPGQDADKSRAVEETVAAKALQQEVAIKYGAGLDALKIPYLVHIVPTSALHLGAHVVQCAGAESAAVVVLPKATSAFLVGYVNQHCAVPIVLA